MLINGERQVMQRLTDARGLIGTAASMPCDASILLIDERVRPRASPISSELRSLRRMKSRFLRVDSFDMAGGSERGGGPRPRRAGVFGKGQVGYRVPGG